MGLTQDISKRKKAEYDRQVQSNALKHILDVLPDSLAVKDMNFIYTLVNKSFCHFMNKPAAEIIGKTDFDLFPQRAAKKYKNLEAEVVQNGREHSVVEEITGAQGKQRCRITRVPILNETTQDTEILVFMRKLSEE